MKLSNETKDKLKNSISAALRRLNGCPCCGSESVEAKGVEVVAGGAKQECFCSDCGRGWTDIYTLAAVCIQPAAIGDSIHITSTNQTGLISEVDNHGYLVTFPNGLRDYIPFSTPHEVINED